MKNLGKSGLLLLVILLSSCGFSEKDPVPVIPENTTGEYYIVFLFELEGVKVYRFQDSGHPRYLAIGPSVQNIQTVQSQTRVIGKLIQTESWNDSVIRESNGGVVR